MEPLLERFRAHLVRRRLFPVPGTAVVAVSGGGDSVALLDLLHAVAGEWGLALVVAHADHQIDPASAAVAGAVRGLAARYGLAFELGELGLGPGTTETRAREARYRWLAAVRRRHAARYLVTAHQRDDQVETILLRALRGSAPAGLAGMPARSRGGVVRPLLPFTKAELAAYVAARGLPSYDDPANADPRHLRSWLRATLLPSLAGRLGARVYDDLLRLGRAAALERRAWDSALQLVPDLELRLAAHGFDVARGALGRYDDAVAVALVRAAARRVGLVLGVRRAQELVALARGASGRRVPLGGGWTAEAAFDRLRVLRPAAAAAARRIVATAAQGSAEFGGYHVAWAPAAAPARLARAEWTTWIAGGATAWEIRPARPGDRVVPLGGVGRRPLRRLLMEAKVPRGDRAAYPVVARGETILWVPGICRSAADLPQPGTPAVRVDVTKRGEPQADGRA
jgi:tRNA(Ile)-lysidine synthase